MADLPPPPPSAPAAPAMEQKPKRSIKAVAPPALSGLITFISGPFVTAREQPPAPGSNWAVRGWHTMRRWAGRAIDVLPKKTTTPMLVLRLVIVVLIWALIIGIAVEVFSFWLFFVAPFLLITRGRRRRASAPPPPATVFASASWGVAPGGPPPPPNTALLLANAPDPDHAPANDSCPMCGGVTTGATGACLYCGSPLPMIAKRGWHPDPLGSGTRRWFDGNSWTQHTRSSSSDD